MASLFNTKISNTYVSIIKTIDNAVITATLKELTDGSGNATGLSINTGGDFKATGTIEWGSLKDTGENITITKFVDEADGIASNDNDTTIPTSAAIVDYVASRITLEDLDFSGTTGTGSVDLDSQVFAITGTANQIETTASSQSLTLAFPSAGIVLPNGSTATTQSAGDNSTKVATTAYVETAVDTVDTLAEILAIGNTTGATKISVDNTSSGIDLIDDAKIRLGTSNDLQIYHDATNSYIDNQTNDLYIRSTGDDIHIQSQDDVFIMPNNGEAGAKIYGGGAVELYFNNNKKIETTSDGATVTGGLTATGSSVFTGATFSSDVDWTDSAKARFGTGNDLEIYHDSSNSYIKDVGTGDLIIQSTNLKLRVNNTEDAILCDANAGVTLYYDGSARISATNAGATIIGTVTADGLDMGDDEKIRLGDSQDLEIYHDGSHSYIDETGTGGLIVKTGDLYLRNPSDADYIYATSGGAVNLYHNGSKKFETTSGGATITGAVTADGLTMGDNEKAIFGTGGDLEVYHSGSTSYISDIGTGDLKVLFSNDFIIEGANGETCAVFTEDASVELYENNVKKLETKSDGVDVYGSLDASGTGNIDVSSTSSDNWASMTIQGSDTSSVYLFLKDTSGERARIQSTANNDIKFLTNGGGDLALELDSSTNASFSNNVTIAGDLTVNGTTTTINTSTIAVEDSMIEMAKDNAANSLDIGTYGKYNDGSARYLGLFADASDDNRFKLFKGTTTQPTTTVDTGATGYEYADILLASLESRGNLTIKQQDDAGFDGGLIITRSANTQKLVIGMDGGAVNFNSPDSLTYKFRANGTEKASIDSSGNAIFAGNINIADSKYVYWGDGNDFYIGHTSTETNLINSTGSLNIEQHTADGNMVFKADDGSGSGVATYFTLDGGSAATNEYYTKWADNSRIAVGTGKDLQIYHDGNNSYIKDAGTGILYIQADNQLRLDCATTGEKFARFYKDGKAELFYDNVSTFETTSTGVTITGALSITGDGSNAATLTESGDGALELDVIDTFTIDAGDQVNIDSGNSEIHLKGSGTTFGKFYKSGDNFYINSPQNDKDIIFTGIDNSAAITALTLDMSNGGSATFRDDIDFGGKLTQTGTGANTFIGDVGIGVAPQQLLHLKSDNPKVYLEDGNAGTDEKVYSIYPAGSQYVIETLADDYGAGQSAYVIDRTGTTVDEQKFYINNTAALTLGASQLATFAGDVTVSKTGARLKLIDGSDQLNIGQWDGSNHRIEGDANRPIAIQSYEGNINLGISGATTMNITSGGVGIKTDQALNRELLVKGEISALAQDSGDNQILMGATSTQVNLSATYGSTGSYVPMEFETGGAVRMTVGADGNVGIGKSASYALDVVAVDSGVQIQMGRTNTNVGSTWMGSDSNGFHLGVGAYGVGNSVSDPNGITITTDGNLYAHTGIMLGANAASNNLDDYEEGTWTPTIKDLSGNLATLSTAEGSYTKIGRVVIVNYNVELSSKGSMTGNYVHLGGIPFNHPTDAYCGTGMIDKFSNMASDMSSLAWDVSSTASVLWLTGVVGTQATSTSYITVAQISDTTKLKGTAIYQTDV